MSATTPQNHPSFEDLFKDLDMVPLALFEYLDLSFLEEFLVFAPDPWGEHGNTKHQNRSRASSTASAEISTASKPSPENSTTS
jgi:hypothetical protein